jgi:hypothetical protein
VSANWTPDIRAFAAANNIKLVPTPTYASYLNRIESHFRPIQDFVFNNTDYRDWDTAQRAAADYITHRNDAERDRRIAALERNTASPHDTVISGQTFGPDPQARRSASRANARVSTPSRRTRSCAYDRQIDREPHVCSTPLRFGDDPLVRVDADDPTRWSNAPGEANRLMPEAAADRGLGPPRRPGIVQASCA